MAKPFKEANRPINHAAKTNDTQQGDQKHRIEPKKVGARRRNRENEANRTQVKADKCIFQFCGLS